MILASNRVLMVLGAAVLVAFGGSYFLSPSPARSPAEDVETASPALLADLQRECLAQREKVLAAATDIVRTALGGARNYEKWCECFAGRLAAQGDRSASSKAEQERVTGELMNACTAALL